MIQLGRFNTLSNYFSLLRVLLAIPLWYVMSKHNYQEPLYLASFIAFVAGLTDYFDGYFARKLNQITEWGKVLDPIGDKVCIAVVIIQFYLNGRIDNLFLWIVVGKDVLIVLASLILSGKVKQVIPSNMLGKYTVTVIALYLFALAFMVDSIYPAITIILYWSSIAMSAASLLVYAVRGVTFK